MTKWANIGFSAKNAATLRGFALVASLLLALGACSPRVDNRGHVAAERRLSDIKPGSSTKRDVLYALGSPSTVSSFGDEEWFYISLKRETVAFLSPENTEQDVVRVTFDGEGTVKSVDHYDEKSVAELALAKPRTPTAGHSYGFFEQIFSNIGRFNKDTSGPRSYSPTSRPGGR